MKDLNSVVTVFAYSKLLEIICNYTKEEHQRRVGRFVTIARLTRLEMHQGASSFNQETSSHVISHPGLAPTTAGTLEKNIGLKLMCSTVGSRLSEQLCAITI